jgi:hypothetical protein
VSQRNGRRARAAWSIANGAWSKDILIRWSLSRCPSRRGMQAAPHVGIAVVGSIARTMVIDRRGGCGLDTTVPTAANASLTLPLGKLDAPPGSRCSPKSVRMRALISNAATAASRLRHSARPCGFAQRVAAWLPTVSGRVLHPLASRARTVGRARRHERSAGRSSRTLTMPGRLVIQPASALPSSSICRSAKEGPHCLALEHAWGRNEQA